MNFASRIESYNKDAGTRLLISQETYEPIADRVTVGKTLSDVMAIEATEYVSAEQELVSTEELSAAQAAAVEVLAARCPGCGYTYSVDTGDEHEGFAAGTAWADIPDTWCCPDCGVREKVDFIPLDRAESRVSFSGGTEVHAFVHATEPVGMLRISGSAEPRFEPQAPAL